MNIIIIGPQGSGKGVQAQLLSKHLRIPHISVGALFRAEKEKKSILGKKAFSFINQGILVPDDVTVPMLHKEFKKKKYVKGFILDGFPRTALQMHMFTIPIDKVILLQVPDTVSIKRISSRLECKKCNKIFGGIITKNCDECSGVLHHRKDDTPLLLRKRLKIYHKEIAPIIKFYKSQEILIIINGDRKIETIAKNIIRRLKA